MSAPPRISVVVPTRNEAESVPVLVERLRGAVPEGLEIVVVDDSDDRTPEVLRGLAASTGGVVAPVIRTGVERRGGLSTAVIAGLRAARGRFVCVMDADLQHPPETIPSMLAAAEAGADLVVASRYVPGGSHGGLDGTVRRLVSRNATRLARLLFPEARHTRDPLSGFFLCRRALVDGVEFRPVGFKVLLELLVLLPGIRVVDVPLRFERRELGSSKATMGQGLQYLRHVRSLVLDVPGAARVLKFGIVGASGVLVFLPLLALLAGTAGLPPAAAFIPAFVVALAWNTLLNRRWTFVDLPRTTGLGGRQYLTSALGAGAGMFAAYLVLVRVGLHPVLSGLAAALVAMAVNAVANYPATRRVASAWAALAGDPRLGTTVEEVGRRLGAQRAYVAGRERAASDDLAGGVVDQAMRTRRALLVTEAASHLPQRRSNIDVHSVLALPLVRDGEAAAVVVLERIAPRGFDQDDLESATHAVRGLAAGTEEGPAATIGAVTVVAATGGAPTE